MRIWVGCMTATCERRDEIASASFHPDARSTPRPSKDSAHFWLFMRTRVDSEQTRKSPAPYWQGQDLIARTAGYGFREGRGNAGQISLPKIRAVMSTASVMRTISVTVNPLTRFGRGFRVPGMFCWGCSGRPLVIPDGPACLLYRTYRLPYLLISAIAMKKRAPL